MTSRYSGFPSGYEHLETAFAQWQQRIKEIDNEIDNMPPDRGYVPPAPRPAGAPPPAPPIPREQRIEALNAEKEEIQSSMRETAKEVTKDADPATAKEVLDKTEIMANPKLYEDTNEKQLAKEIGEEKELDKSQEVANRLRFDAKYLNDEVDKPRNEKEANLKDSVDKFINDTKPQKEVKEEAPEPEKTKEQKLGEMKENSKDAFEKNMDTFFKETSIEYAQTRDDITKAVEPSDPGGNLDER